MSVPTRVRLGAAIIAALTMAACGNNGSPKAAAGAGAPPGSAPGAAASAPNGSDFVEPFDNNDDDWPIRSDSDGTRLAVTNGEYEVTLPSGNIRYIRPAALADRQDLQSDVSVSSKVRVLDGTSYSVGLACRMDPADKQYYIGRVFRDGSSALVRREKGKGEFILRNSQANPVRVEPGGVPLQLVLLCGEKNGTMSLSLSINGTVTVQADDPTPLPDNPPGIYAVAGLNTPTSSFAFDDIRVGPYQP